MSTTYPLRQHRHNCSIYSSSWTTWSPGTMISWLDTASSLLGPRWSLERFAGPCPNLLGLRFQLLLAIWCKKFLLTKLSGVKKTGPLSAIRQLSACAFYRQNSVLWLLGVFLLKLPPLARPGTTGIRRFSWFFKLGLSYCLSCFMRSLTEKERERDTPTTSRK